MGDRELPFKELTHKIIGCSMEVHRVLVQAFRNTFIKGPSLLRRNRQV